MNQHIRAHGELEQRVDALSREVAPSRDLWPGIESRLGAGRARSTRTGGGAWPWLQLTAALAAGYALATWLPLPGFGPAPEPEATYAELALVEDVQPALARLPAKTRSVVEADLAGFEQDWLHIEQALAEDPDNPLLQELLMSTADRAASLRAQMIRITGAMPTDEVEI